MAIWVKGLPREIWALGFVSMFMDISSEMIHSLLPVFLVTVIGSSALSVGLIEGVAEATALITRIFSGALSDFLGKRKALAIAGYALGTLTKPLFALSSTVGLVFTARFFDRVGKGLRGAPRDALIADVTPAHNRGAAYGLRQSLDTLGALIGPLLAMGLMVVTAGDFRQVFWVAVAPGSLAVAVLFFMVKEPGAVPVKAKRKLIDLREIFQLKPAYWMVVAFGSIFALARFSEAFLLLRAQSVHMNTNMIPVVLVVMNIFYTLTSYPVGRLSDRLGRTGLLAAGLGVLILSDLVLAVAETGWTVAAGTALWGLHMGLSQGLISAMVADTAPQDLRGTAFGVFSMVSGITLLFSSVIAGCLWDIFGAPATFFAGAAFAAIALLGYVFLLRRAPSDRGNGGGNCG
ncbi:MAG: MFS transporter [Desulfobacterales bacterium]|nr:MFS transporter [Desulfobacterales bacterium]